MEYKKKTYSKNTGTTEKRSYGDKETRSYGSKDLRKDGDTETRTFEGTLKSLMTEEEKSNAQILELSYDFSCRIIRLYKSK